MRNIFRDIMLHAYEEVAGVPIWKMWLALAVMFVCVFVATAGVIFAAFVAGGRAIDWAFVLLVTTGILVLVVLLGIYVGEKMYQQTKRQR